MPNLGHMGNMSAQDVQASRGTAADIRAKNAERFQIKTPDALGASEGSGPDWAIATPDSLHGSPPLRPTQTLGVTQALLKRMLPYGSGAKVTADETVAGKATDDDNFSVMPSAPALTPRQPLDPEEEEEEEAPLDELAEQRRGHGAQVGADVQCLGTSLGHGYST